MTKTYNPDYPIVLGLTGEAATGKTVTANGLAPTVRVVEGNETGIFWEHLYFAMPLYQMSNARQTIEGEMAFDRMCYEIHSTLLEVWSSPLYGAPSYEELVEMVLEIAEYPCPREGKPRTFLQHVGTDLCRKYDPDCWVNWMRTKIQKEYVAWRRENIPVLPTQYTLSDVDNGLDVNSDIIDAYEDAVEQQKWGVVISDVRFPNEAEFIKNHPNGVLIKLTATDDVLRERQYDRDGVVMTASQMQHASEVGVSQIPTEWFNKILDTTDLTVQQQVDQVRRVVQRFVGA